MFIFQKNIWKSFPCLECVFVSEESQCAGCPQFGEVDIDGALVASHSSASEEIMMVNNGCLCCTVRGDLVKMLLELVKKKRDKFDHIVIETTGTIMPLFHIIYLI